MKPALVVLAAGMGSRYGGIKQIDGVGRYNETLLDYATFDARMSGFGSVVYIIRKDIEAAFRERIFDRVAKNFDARYVFQSRESLLNAAQIEASKNRLKPWGTAHAVLCARDAVTTPFAVINADDYYGRAAFEVLGGYLSGISNDCVEHAMVAYVLGNTLSKTGSVSRGVCGVKDGGLLTIQEHKKISYENDKIVSHAGEKITFTGDEPVSMNFFGFSPAVFDSFSELFARFIEKNIANETSECLLPECADAIVSSKKGKIRVFTSKESWFGMTYPEDREIVRVEIAKKIKEAYYPDRLWERE
jgi:NDP-sugar pyrophosphorylase family protein